MPGRTRGLVLLLVVLSLLAGGLTPVAAASKKSTPKLQMYETVVDTATAQAIISSGDYDVVTIDPVGDGQVQLVLVLYPWQKTTLAKLGVSLSVWKSDKGKTADQLAKAQEAAGFKVWRPYDGSRGIAAWMHGFAAANPDIAKLEVIGQTWGTDPEGDGPDTPRDILAIKLTGNANATPDNSRPAVLYTSLQHAREWISTEVNRRLLDWYAKGYRNKTKDIVNLLNTTELWFVLVANPDGYQYTFDTERLWRKNLRDNDGDNVITAADGVDPNRNYPEHWNWDDEGSSSEPSNETYRGPAPASEPETQAIVGLYDRVDFRFHINYHSFGQLLLSPFGAEVNVPTADDPIYIALQGTDKHPAIPGFDPGVGADLYTTNGETTDFAHMNGSLAWTPELSEGPNGDGFVFPDSEGAIQAEFNRNLPFARSVAMSAADPDNPVSSVGITTKPFYLDVSEIDPQKAHNPMSDFSFAVSYGDPQTVEVLAKRDIDNDDNEDPVTVHWSVDGQTSTAGTTEWQGGARIGGGGNRYYRIMRGEVSGFDPGDQVTVWFSGAGATSESFTFTVAVDEPADVLVLAAEDRTGAANDPAYESSTAPNYLDYYADALDANGIDFDVYDVDANGRQAPDHIGVLSHYAAVVWYTGNDYLTREPGQVAGTGAATLANSNILEVRAYLNEGGHLLHTGRHAGWQAYNAFEYNPVTTPPFCDGTVNESTGLECLLLSDDFYQYWLGAAMFIEDGGTGADEEPVPIDGTAGPFAGSSWTLNGGDSADNHHPNPVRGTTQSLLTTSSLLSTATYPQFTSTGPATWDTGVAGAFEPFSGSWYTYSGRSDVSYKRLVRTISVPAGDTELSFKTSYDTELDWDFLFVEARTAGDDDWVTLPDLEGSTSNSTGESCPEGWFELHPWLEQYQGADCAGAGWNAVSGRSPGWVDFKVDLSAWAGGEVEVSISYASDWSFQGLGVFLDDIDAPGSAADTDFEADSGGWTVAGPPPESRVNGNDWTRTRDVGFVEGAATSMDPPGPGMRTLYFGFGFEGITSAAERNTVMGQAMDYLLAP